MTNHGFHQHNLPAGWTLAKLGDLCLEIETTDPKKNPDLEFTYIDISSIDRSTKTINAPAVLFGKDAPSRAKRVVRSGDVLVATTRPNLNAVALVEEEYDGQVCSTGICVLRPNCDLLDSEYLYFGTRNADFVNSLSGAVQGAMYPAVTDRQVLDQVIPLPPPAEQKRIVDVLNEQMAAVERAKRAAAERLEAAQVLRRTLLRTVWPLEAEYPSSWKWRLLSEVSTIDYGYTASADFTSSGPRFLRITDIQDGQVDWERVPSCDIDEGNERKKTLQTEDIVFARTGGTTGKSFFVENPPRSVFASYLLRVRVDKTVEPNYLKHFFNSDQYWMHITDNSRGGAQPNVNAKLLGSLKIPLPPRTEQERIAEILDTQMIGAENVGNAIRSQQLEVDRISSALLRRAFSGEV